MAYLSLRAIAASIGQRSIQLTRLDVVHAAIGIGNSVGRIDFNRLAMVLDRETKLTCAPERVTTMIVCDGIVGLAADQFGARSD